VSEQRTPSEHLSCWEKAAELQSELSLSLAREQRLREALEVAADDLGKAANQFAGAMLTWNEKRFAEKEARARDALSPVPDGEQR
jgi:hypothetical protein